jgi:hypothetical protein
VKIENIQTFYKKNKIKNSKSKEKGSNMKTKQNKRANSISINDEIKKKIKVYKINQDENHTKKNKED